MTHHAAHDDIATDGLWQRFAGKAKRIWGDLTDDELLRYEGRFDEAIGFLKQKYGEAADEFAEWWEEEQDKDDE